MTSLQHVSPRVKGIRVSPHSRLQSLAADIKQRIALGVEVPFKEVIDVSSGDPHKAGLKPITFVRQVLAACLYPQLMKDGNLAPDVRQRAQRLLEACDGGSVGSYTNSSGIPYVKQSIAEFIMRRDDGVPSFAKNIFISTGSQTALMLILHVMTGGEEDTQTGVLIPKPSPHTLAMVLDEARVTGIPYQLVEERGWALDLDELHQALKSSRGQCNPKAIYISNPGNPTGHVQDRKSIEEIIQFAAAERLLLFVDEVYQDSVYGQGREFLSYKKVLSEMDKEYLATVELISFHSLSNAWIGECGLRAGYMEVINMDPQVMRALDTVTRGQISAPVMGQLALDVMVNPPKPGDPSYDTYRQEILLMQITLSQNAKRAQKFLNDLPGMSCQPGIAGIYLYPCLHLSPEFAQQAKILEVEADVLYCQRLLEEEGVLVGAGHQFEKTTGKHHLSLCILIPPGTMEEVLTRLGSFHLRLMSDTSSS